MSPPTPEDVLRRIEWKVIRRLDGLLQGDYRTLFFGHGLDLADIREYEPGDDVRYIDWNVTARMDRPFVRRYVEDREITAWFLLDLSPSMDFGTARMLKRALVVEAVGVLARLLTRHGNAVGAIVYGSRVERTIRPRAGRIHVLRLLNDVMRHPTPARPSVTSLGDLLTAANATLRRRSLVFLVSDLVSSAGWERPLALLARRHDVIAIRVVDPAERMLPDIGPVTLTDAETGEQVRVETQDRAFRRRLAALVGERDRAFEATFRRLGVDLFPIGTDGDLVRAILRFALARRLRRAQRHGPIVSAAS